MANQDVVAGGWSGDQPSVEGAGLEYARMPTEELESMLKVSVDAGQAEQIAKELAGRYKVTYERTAEEVVADPRRRRRRRGRAVAPNPRAKNLFARLVAFFAGLFRSKPR
jgi:hypothetical protein